MVLQKLLLLLLLPLKELLPLLLLLLRLLLLLPIDDAKPLRLRCLHAVSSLKFADRVLHRVGCPTPLYSGSGSGLVKLEVPLRLTGLASPQLASSRLVASRRSETCASSSFVRSSS